MRLIRTTRKVTWADAYGADTRVVNEAGRTAEELASRFDQVLQLTVRRAGLKTISGITGEQEREKPIF